MQDHPTTDPSSVTKTWTLSERPVTRKTYRPKALRVNQPLIRTYLLCALSRHSLLGSKYISVHQATNIIEAVKFAKSIGVPLVAHATIHWSGTIAFDDHNGLLFA